MEPMSLVFAIFFLAIGAGLVAAEGGPSTFGYDASSACNKRVSRAYVEKLPCDFSRDNWCTIAGNAYPWQAVRRFVHENQGLMKRMYGDEKHISVLKTEFDKHDVELELADEHNHLYSDDSNSLFSKYQFDMEYDIDHPVSQRRSREYSPRSPNIGTSIKPPNDFEDSAKESSASSTTSSTTSSSSSSPTTPHRTKMSPVPPLEAQSSPSPLTSTTPIVMLAQIAKIQNLSINEIPGQQMQIDRFDANVEEITEISTNKTSNDDDDDDLEDIYSNIDDDDDDGSGDGQFRPRPEYRPPDAAKPETSHIGSVPRPTGGQLYQDTMNKDKKEETPVLKVRGTNACTVKEEVVAPFWANNTRGEVLALINVYPFEQYVHWEKCTHEKKQMYCRDGCRCEQQHRLHRLLAYDPNNECRGIFSDWFRFPSCCICQCYDLPLEFRVTSRSPRTSLATKRKLRVRAPQPPPKRQRID